MAQDYDKKIEKLKKKNVKDIEDLLNEFMLNLNKVQNEFNISKQTGESLRVYYREKLKSQDGNFHDEIYEMEAKHRDKKRVLNEEWKTKERDHSEKLLLRDQAKRESILAAEELKVKQNEHKK